MNINSKNPKILVGIDLGDTETGTAIFHTKNLKPTNIWRNRIATPDNYQSTLEVYTSGVRGAALLWTKDAPS